MGARNGMFWRSATHISSTSFSKVKWSMRYIYVIINTRFSVFQLLNRRKLYMVEATVLITYAYMMYICYIFINQCVQNFRDSNHVPNYFGVFSENYIVYTILFTLFRPPPKPITFEFIMIWFQPGMIWCCAVFWQIVLYINIWCAVSFIDTSKIHIFGGKNVFFCDITQIIESYIAKHKKNSTRILSSKFQAHRARSIIHHPRKCIRCNAQRSTALNTSPAQLNINKQIKHTLIALRRTKHCIHARTWNARNQWKRQQSRRATTTHDRDALLHWRCVSGARPTNVMATT